MPGADYGPLSQGSGRDFRAISPITQPQDRRMRLQAHSWACGGPYAATSQPQPVPTAGRNETATQQRRVRQRFTLHRPDLFPRSPVPGGRLRPPGSTKSSPCHPPNLHMAAEPPTSPPILNLRKTPVTDYPTQARATPLRVCGLSLGKLGPQLGIVVRRKETNSSSEQEK